MKERRTSCEINNERNRKKEGQTKTVKEKENQGMKERNKWKTKTVKERKTSSEINNERMKH